MCPRKARPSNLHETKGNCDVRKSRDYYCKGRYWTSEEQEYYNGHSYKGDDKGLKSLYLQRLAVDRPYLANFYI